ncbi:MAG TPA: hypothetical protein P5055_04260 [Candidatus Paceibacterota bacterium]|nr:hypothetical protein [Candidatus Paceibacterota bacterium]
MSDLGLLSVVLGLGVSVPQLYALANPGGFARLARQFPRSLGWGYVLMALGTAGFLYNLSLESVADFAPYKRWMYLGFAAVGILSCLYVRDFLAVRGLAIVLLLLAKLMVDTAHWADSLWRLVIVVWAYALVLAGIWLTVSPWRMRDLINWAVATDNRTRILAVCRLVFGLFVALLGFTVF